MSWSVQFIGNPENVSKALDENSEKLSGVSKEEYDAALPHMKALVEQNYNKSYPIVIQINASGHAWEDTTNSYSNCNVTITPLGGQLV